MPAREFQKNLFLLVFLLGLNLNVDYIFQIAHLLSTKIVFKENTYEYRWLWTDSSVERKIEKILWSIEFA